MTRKLRSAAWFDNPDTTDMTALCLEPCFVSLAQNGESEVDLGPPRLVADAFMRGHTGKTDPFED